MHKNIIYLTIVCLFIGLSYAEVTIESLTPFLESEGGQALNLVLAFENTSDTDATIKPELELPIAWRVLIPLGKVTVAANSETVIPFTISVPKSAAAGTHEIVVTTEDKSSEAVFTVNVAAVSSLEVKFIDLPERAIAEPYTVEAVLTNSGNQDLALDVYVDENLGFAISPNQLQILLEPQQHKSIDIQVTPPKEFYVQENQSLVLRAFDTKTLEQIASTRGSVTLIPAQRSDYANWQLFPITLNISTSRLSFQENSLEDISFSLSGRGKLTDADDSFLDFSINSDALLQDNRFSIKYTAPNYGISLANSTIFFSGAIFRTTGADSVRASGYYYHKFQDNLSVTPYFYASVASGLTSNLSLGLRANYAFSTSHSLSSAFEANYSEQEKLLLAARTSYGNQFSDFRTRLSATYLTQLKDDEVASQFTTTARSDNGTHIFNASYKQVQEGYRESDSSTSNLDFSYTLRNHDLKGSLKTYSYNHWEYSSQDISTQEHRFGITANYTVGKNNWRLNTEYTTFPETQENNHWETSLQFFQRYSRNSYLRHRLSFLHNFNDSTRDRLSYSANLLYPMSGFKLQPSVRFEFDPYELSLVNFNSAIALVTDTDFGSAALTASYKPFNTNYFQLNTTLDFDLNNQNEFVIEAGTLFSETSDVNVYVKASYRYKFDVPVSRKTKVATVTGFLRDREGQALADILVEVSGQFTQTNSDGQFQLTNVLAGEVYFKIVEGQLPTNQITTPASPYFFRAEAQQTYDLEFNVVEAASIQVQARYEEVAAKDDTIVSEVDRENLLNRLEVVLSSDQGDKLKLRTNDQGYILATGLLAGEWRADAYLIADEGNISIEVSSPQFVVEEGEEVNIDIVLRPRERKLKIIDGGSVTFDLNQEE